METKTLKTVKIFVASAAELSRDRVEFGNFINKLRVHYRTRGFDFDPIEWEYLENDDRTHRKQDEYNEHIKDCDVFVSLFYTKAGEYTIEEYEIALKQNKKRKLPMLTFMRELEDGIKAQDSLIDFQKKYCKQYYWGKYGNNDKLHLDFALWLDKFLLSNSTFSVNNGVITLGDVPVADMSQLSFAINNKEYQQLKASIKKLDKDIEEARKNIEKYPDDPGFPATLSQKIIERNKSKEEFERQQDALLGAAKQIAELRKQQVSENLQEAINAFESGQLDVANRLLQKLEKDGDQLMEEIDTKHEQMHEHIEAQLLQVKTVMAEAEKPIEERIKRVEEIYAKADDWASRSAYKDEKYAKLLFDYAQFYYKYGPYDKGIEIYLRQITLSEKLYGTDSKETATSYNNIGTVYENQGEYDKALEYYFKALDIYEKVLGKEHSSTATSYNNIGLVYDNQGKYDKALEYHFKALNIRDKVLGKEHPDTAQSYNNIGGVYEQQGKYDKALEYHFKALEIEEKVLGTEHPDTATDYNNIGGVYKKQGEYDKALEYYGKAFDIREKVLGKEHPDTATSYNNIGWVYRARGDYETALEYYEKAYAIRMVKLGEKHPDTQSVKLSIEIMKDMMKK